MSSGSTLIDGASSLVQGRLLLTSLSPTPAMQLRFRSRPALLSRSAYFGYHEGVRYLMSLA